MEQEAPLVDEQSEWNILDEEQFWVEVYNLNVQEFVTLLEEEFAVVGVLPEMWSEGRTFPVGKPDWDMLVNAVTIVQALQEEDDVRDLAR